VSERKVVQLEDGSVRVELGDRVYLVGGECPHRKGRMSFGYIHERALRISCPLHHSTFDLATGCKLAGPAECPLPVFTVNGG
jgi:nitrite reductase/ring-hydroxylating ferredoxin subunit